MMLLMSFVFSLHAYEAVFKLQSDEEILRNSQSRYENEVLKKSCQLEKRRGGFLWPCYLSTEIKMTTSEMVQDCKIKIENIQSLQRLPDARQTKRLPVKCQELVLSRRQVLAYKAKGI